MANKCHICLLGLIILCPLFTGINGVEETRVFCSFGEDVILPCNNALSDCNSTTWNYSRNRNSAAVELFAGGMKKYDIKRHERLSLGSNCSLNIDKATEEDHGHYTCLQYVNKQRHGNDARVLLHVLHIFPSSTQNEIRPGNSVTLSCQLYSHDGVSCDILDHTEGIQLFWVNQAGANLQTDSRYLISSSGHCNITLTTTLLNEDNNIEWRCQVNERNEVKTSASYTVKYLGPLDTPITPTQVIVIVVVIAALAVLIPAVVLSVICRKRAENRKGIDSSMVTYKDEYKGTYETINISIPTTPSANGQTDVVTYCEVTASSSKQMKKNNVHSYDKVTYATIR
ncbi:uncharacterized protein LOC127453848 [Myxocyprinus asiaticus]|uniref:uncharacterized protein LOC127453848 n=1 Tax=Myxocyprinus asiaticus TaxID=70543 RepID=UPI0022231F2D|nr:uncharacterized protein LOC127453848 [Myxocyprinus asiaticus]